MSDIFIVVLNMSIIASYAAVGVLMIRRLLKKTPKVFSYMLWMVVFFRMLCPFSFESIFSVLPANSELASSETIFTQTPDQLYKGSDSTKANDPFPAMTKPPEQSGLNTGTQSSNDMGIETAVPSEISAGAATIRPNDIFISIGSYLWLTGIVFMLCYAIISYIKIKRRLYDATLFKENIYESEHIHTPFVLGIIRPRIYILTKLNARERNYIIKHEQTHIRRGDHIIKSLAYIALALHWFNPLMWVSFILMSKDMEMSCDESVLKHENEDIRSNYSLSLLSLSSKQHALPNPLAFGENNVKSRVRNVLYYRKPSYWITAVAMTTVTFASVALASNQINPVSHGGNATGTNQKEIRTTYTDSDFLINWKGKLSEQQIELTVWESLDGPDEFIKQAGSKFTELFPNITVKFANVESNEAAITITMDGPAGVGPDLFAAPHDKMGDLVAGGFIKEVQNPDVISANLSKLAVNGATFDKIMYGYPVACETYALYYNKDLISASELPDTFEELIAWGKAFQAESGNMAFGVDVGNAYYSILFGSSTSNRLFGLNGTDTTSTFMTSDDAIQGYQFFQSIRNELFNDVNAEDLTGVTLDAAFLSGKLATYISDPRNIAPFSDADINYGVVPIPSLPGLNEPPSTFADVRCMFVSEYTTHPDEATAFAEFLMTDEIQKLRAEITSTIPASNVDVETGEVLNGFKQQLEYAYPMPKIPHMSKYWTIFGTAFEEIWNGNDVEKQLEDAEDLLMSYF